MTAPADRHWETTQGGYVVAAGLWVGPKDAANPFASLYVVCPACGVEQVTRCEFVVSSRREMDVRLWRDESGKVHIESERVCEPLRVVASCGGCRRRLSVLLRGREVNPWWMDADDLAGGECSR